MINEAGANLNQIIDLMIQNQPNCDRVLLIPEGIVSENAVKSQVDESCFSQKSSFSSFQRWAWEEWWGYPKL